MTVGITMHCCSPQLFYSLVLQSPADVFNQGGPIEMNSDPYPMCQNKRFANKTMARHAATCNYDPENH